MRTSPILNDKQLLKILSLYTNPIAIYTSHDIVIEMANNAMLAAWGRGPEIIGKTLSEALPEISSQPFVKMLQQVWATGVDDIGEAIIADLVIDGELQRFYFDYEYRAIKDEVGAVYAIMHTATDVTEKTLNRAALETAKAKELIRTEMLARSESRLRYLLSDAPIAIAVVQGRELVIESANKKMLEAWGKTDEIIGKALHVGIPELIGQEFLSILDHVFTTGIPYYGYEVKALFQHKGKTAEVYSNFVYQPLKDEQGNTRSIMLTASVVSEQVVARHQVQQLNEELIVINEELSESQERLMSLNINLQESETRLYQILSELPAPVVVLLGPDQIISTTNQALLNFWDRTKEEVIGKPMLTVFPELINQQFPALWKQVLETGEKIINREKQVVFKDRNTGNDKPFYVDYYYQPLTDISGQRIGVLATVLDVTDKVISRRKIEEAEEQLRLAIDSTELGTWYIDALTRNFISSPRLREIFGFHRDEEIPYLAAIEQVLEEYREQVKTGLENAIVNGGQYDMEYPIKRLQDRQIRWVRATGKLYTGENIGSANFIGTVQDITERKLEEQRKDDFLSIASHELKTPVTTLKGAVQLLSRYKSNPAHPMIPRLIDQANVSVEKITNLLDDLLNTTRTNEGQLHLNKKRFTIADMLKKCCNHIRMGGKHELILQGDENLQIDADQERIDQVVVNFVNNAAKYAPQSREIYLIIENLNDKARISVKDLGPGIPAEKIPHIFDRYYRADYGGAQYSGLGLGLYISSEIVKRHHGEIGVDSKIGEGSTFWFTLPINPS